MKPILLILVMNLSVVLKAQQKFPLPPNQPPQLLKQTDETICELPAVTIDAQFYSGKEGLAKFVETHLEYPKKARRKRTTGKVIASFMIERDGTISEIKILQSLPNGCDEAVINLIKRMPKWRPAMKNGNPIRFLHELPVEFELEKIKTQ